MALQRVALELSLARSYWCARPSLARISNAACHASFCPLPAWARQATLGLVPSAHCCDGGDAHALRLPSVGSGSPPPSTLIHHISIKHRTRRNLSCSKPLQCPHSRFRPTTIELRALILDGTACCINTVLLHLRVPRAMAFPRVVRCSNRSIWPQRRLRPR